MCLSVVQVCMQCHVSRPAAVRVSVLESRLGAQCVLQSAYANRKRTDLFPQLQEKISPLLETLLPLHAHAHERSWVIKPNHELDRDSLGPTFFAMLWSLARVNCARVEAHTRA